MVQAMRHAKPVIASVHDAASDVVEHERTGLLVDQDDHAALATAMIGLLENLVGFYVSPAYKGGVALILFLAVILVRPEGLLGKAEERKV